MKRTMPLILALLVASGCGRRANEGVAEGPAGEKLMVHSLQKISLAQGESKKFSVAVQRVKLEGPVQLTFDTLPKGTHLEPGDATVPADKNDIILNLKVDANAPPLKETPIQITATLDKYHATTKLLVEITESLDLKATQKDAFVKDMKNRLDGIKKQLDGDQEKINSLAAQPKADFQKSSSKLSETYATTRKTFDSLVATPLEEWQRMQGEVSTAVANLEKSVAAFQDSLNKAAMK